MKCGEEGSLGQGCLDPQKAPLFSRREETVVGRIMPAAVLAVSFILSSVQGQRAGPELLCRLWMAQERQHREVEVPLVSIMGTQSSVGEEVPWRSRSSPGCPPPETIPLPVGNVGAMIPLGQATEHNLPLPRFPAPGPTASAGLASFGAVPPHPKATMLFFLSLLPSPGCPSQLYFQTLLIG